MNIRAIPKSILVLIVLLILLLIGSIVLFLTSGSATQDPVDQPTPIPTISPTPLPVVDTGGTEEIDPLPPQESQEVNLEFDLRQQLPIETSDFILDYNYADSYFVVFLNSPYQESINAFSLWLDQNGYSDIPQEEFIFESL